MVSLSRQSSASSSPRLTTPDFWTARFESVQAQSLTDWECIVVDDGSTDETFAIANSYAAVDQRFRAAKPSGRGSSAARNTGYALTNPCTKFMTFMDSDDVWLPHALETLWSRLQPDPTAIGAHGLAEMVDESGTWSLIGTMWPLEGTDSGSKGTA